MDTMKRVGELAEEHGLSMFQLSQLCGIPYTTLKSTRARHGQLGVDTIERVCMGLNISMSGFFDVRQ